MASAGWSGDADAIPIGGPWASSPGARVDEVDAIVELADGRWAAFEIELGQTAIDQAATSLSKFRDVVDIERRGEPAVLGVITRHRIRRRPR